MRILVIGEGEHEKRALPSLVRRINGHINSHEFNFFRNGRRVHGKGHGMYKKAVGWILDALSRDYDAVVLLIDEDGDRSRREQMDDAQNYGRANLPRACGVAIRTFDAWFLADEKALGDVLEVNVARQPDPESERDPKERCAQFIANSISVGSLSDMYTSLVGFIDIETLASRCTEGFAPFAERVRALSQATGCDRG